jgi:DNA-binding response OmpR family regulator
MLYVVLEHSKGMHMTVNDALVKYGKDRGYNIKSFDDPDSAYKFLSEITNPRLIAIVDSMHPKAGNFIRRIKGHPETSKRYPVMIVVSPSQIDKVTTMVSDMADDFIISPPNPQELVLRLNQLRMKLAIHDRNRS